MCCLWQQREIFRFFFLLFLGYTSSSSSLQLSVDEMKFFNGKGFQRLAILQEMMCKKGISSGKI